jgi:hypothetical protein
LTFFLFFFQFHHPTLGWLWIRLHDLFQFDFYEVISISWLESQVWRVTQLTWVFFLSFLIDIFSISSFNVELIMNWASWFILICFLWGHLGFMIRVTCFAVDSVCFIVFFFYIDLFFFHFQHLTMSLLKIKLYNLFWLAFYGVITVSWF